jgi:hypothetical protein
MFTLHKQFANAQPQLFSLSGTAADISLERLEAADECMLLGIPPSYN